MTQKEYVAFILSQKKMVGMENKEPKILATKLTPEEFSTENLKELYAKKMDI